MGPQDVVGVDDVCAGVHSTPWAYRHGLMDLDRAGPSAREGVESQREVIELINEWRGVLPYTHADIPAGRRMGRGNAELRSVGMPLAVSGVDGGSVRDRRVVRHISGRDDLEFPHSHD